MRKDSIYNATRHVGDFSRRTIDPYEDLANAIIERIKGSDVADAVYDAAQY